MKKDYPSILGDPNDTMAQLTRGIRNIIEGYMAMSSVAKADGCLDKKTKGLIAMAIGVAVRCGACIASHTKAARKNGAGREEVLEALGISVFVGRGPSVVYAS